MIKKSNDIPQTKDYFNISQLRIDMWNAFKNNAQQLQKNGYGKTEPVELKASIESNFDTLKKIETYWSYPGKDTLQILLGMYRRKEYTTLTNSVSDIVRMLVSDAYRSNPPGLNTGKSGKKKLKDDHADAKSKQNYFEVLFIDNITEREEEGLKEKFRFVQHGSTQFVYDVLVSNTLQDALIALLFNFNIQACVIRYGIPLKSKNDLSFLKPFISRVMNLKLEDKTDDQLGPILGKLIKQFRPELDLYYVTDTSVYNIDDASHRKFKRIFYRKEDLQELHLSIIRGIKDRYETPFFSALMEYSQKPTGVFHAMPISRGNSVFKSWWIKDFGDFYGRNLFLAETSATTGGLDSLLQPVGPLKTAQELAAKAFGSEHTFFVTNGTSTSNKIIVQALVEPGDLVLIDRDCHKSHHYGLVLAGAYPVYLDSYPVEEYSMYGAVPLKSIKEKLLHLKKAGQLDKVKMLLLTNCTFDGIVYNVERVMEEVLAIKPDMVFLWDEAWFAFAGFTYNFKQRTAMFTADKLYQKYNSPQYKEEYKEHLKKLKKPGGKDLPAMPDPDKVKIRVYSTQSTHKTLSSFRQGSMIHIHDEEFKRKAESSFMEAYMTHISTSANYQILASLDAGRRQVQFEGYELVEKSIEMAMILRSKIQSHPKLKKYFDVLTLKNFIPEEYRKSGIDEYFSPDTGWNRMEEAWEKDEFVLDPTKINLFIGKTGLDGDTFKNKYLMDQFGIQINKTSRNTVLFMTNIGTTRGSIAFLIGVLLKIAKQLDDNFNALNSEELKIKNEHIRSLTKDVPPLPNFSHFHSSFQALPGVPGGNIRKAFFLSYDENNCDYIKLKDCIPALNKGKEIVSTSFVIPYPPGFPILVPGQVLSRDILEFFINLDVHEIHGYRPDLGLKIFKASVLNTPKTTAVKGVKPGKPKLIKRKK